MRTHTYSERDYAFGQAMVTLRTAISLTQLELAQRLGISRAAVLSWEAGSSYPKAEHLKRFIALGVQQQAFAAGREEEEIRALWHAAHQKALLDEPWLSTLLGQLPPSLPRVVPGPSEGARPRDLPGARPASGRRVGWEQALAVPSFYGRQPELAILEQWIVQEHCRVVSVLGMGGIGKSALAVTFMHRVVERFEVVLFRSLRDAPSCESLLEDCLQVLSPRPAASVPASLEGRLSLLLERLREQRALLVLDNLDALLQEGEIGGHYRPGFEGYGQVLRRVGETTHQSCLLLTSREKPVSLVPLEGTRSPVRAMRLVGLERDACEQLLGEKGVLGTREDWGRLVEAYAGNPLALKVVAETIADLFEGSISLFLKQGTAIFGSIQDLLTEQVSRLSAVEQTVLRWLAIGREPLGLEDLLALLVVPLPQGQVLAAVDSLRRRSLIERGKLPGSVTLQSVVLEYVTGLLIEEATSELAQGRLSRLIEHGLCQTGAREDVRQAQERLIVAPILAGLRSAYPGRAEVEEHLLSLLAQLRERADYAQGYGPANLVALLRQQRGHLRGLDLSQLALRGAYLQGVEMQDTSLAGATLRDTVFTETFDAILAVAISSTGQYWAAASRQGEVRVWEARGQTLHLVWQVHTDITYALTFSPDGRSLVSGGWDGSIKLWEVASGALLWSSRHTNNITGGAFAPDGSLLATCGNDATVQLWDLKSGTHLESLPHPDPVFVVTWSPDGRLLASGGLDGQIRLWEIQKTQPATCVHMLTGHTAGVTGLAFAPDGSTLASGSWDQTVKLWEVESLHLRQTLAGHTERVTRVAWSPDGRTLASGGHDKTILLWEVAQGSYRAALQGYTAEVTSLAFTPDSCSLLSGSEDGTLRLWDVASGQCVRLVQGYAASLFDLDWSPDGTQVVSGGMDTLVIVWEVTDGTPPRVLHGHHAVVFGVGWSPDSHWLASSGWDNVISLWDPTTGTCLERQRDPDNHDTFFFGVAWNPDGQRLASGTYARGVLVWDVAARSHRWVGRQLPTLIRGVAWSPDGTRLVGGGGDGQVYLWNASDGTLLQRLVGHHGGVTSVAWSPDGTRLASGGGSSDSGELFMWGVQSGERVRAFAGHLGVVSAVTWSPSGELLLSGGSDGMLRWWDVQSGECLQVRRAHQGTVQSLKLSPDGSRLASCGDDGAINIWDLESSEHLRTLRRDRPYERLDISGVQGLTDAQRATLRALGAIEEVTLPH